MTKQMDGAYYFRPDADRLDERAGRAETVTRCAFCAAVFHGTAEEGRGWAESHRQMYHPAAVDRGQRARLDAARARPKDVFSMREGYGE